jgi:hypothetical protein
MESEDGIADDIRHRDQATDASRNEKNKPRQHVRVQNSMRKVLANVRKVATGVGKVAAEEVSAADTSPHTDQATDASTNAKHKPTQHGGLHYGF